MRAKYFAYRSVGKKIRSVRFFSTLRSVRKKYFAYRSVQNFCPTSRSVRNNFLLTDLEAKKIFRSVSNLSRPQDL